MKRNIEHLITFNFWDFFIFFLSKYRGSQHNRVIRGIVLIGDWFSTKNCETDKFNFQSPLFYTKNLIILFRNQFLMHLNIVGSKVLIFDGWKTNFYNCKNSILRAKEWIFMILDLFNFGCRGIFISFLKNYTTSGNIFWKILLNWGITLFSTIFKSY
jgi:hypothetical protein